MSDDFCQDLKEIGENNAVEGKLGNGKRELGLSLIVAKLKGYFHTEHGIVFPSGGVALIYIFRACF